MVDLRNTEYYDWLQYLRYNEPDDLLYLVA